MELKIHIEEENGLTIVYASGELDAVTAGTLEDNLNGLIDKGVERIILDLDGVPYVSSAGLRVFLATAQKLDIKGKFALSRLNSEVKEILEITGFTNILEWFDDLAEAQASLSKG
jgi:anti-anti-sigma factor